MMEIKRVIAFVIILPVLISLAAFSGSASAPESTNLTQSLVNTTAEKHPDFLLDKSILRLVMEKDMLEKEEIIITNNIDDDIRVAVEENMGFLSAESFVVIEKRREISLSLNFLSNETGVFTGTLLIRSDSSVVKLPVVAEVETAEKLADIKIDASARFKEAFAGEQIAAQVSAYNFIGEKKDFAVRYTILDMHNNKISEYEETISVLDKSEFVKSFELPAYLKEGDYILAAEVRYGNSAGTSSFLFNVAEEKRTTIAYLSDYRLYSIALILALVIFIFFFMNYKKLKDIENLRNPTRIYKIFKERETLENARIAAKKLIRQQQILDGTFNSGYITERSYKIVKKRIQGMLNEIKRKLER